MNLIFKRARILIVEDEKIIAKDIESTLKRIGHESAGTVSKGEDAIELAGVIKPDLILMDITLKGELDGIEAARIINESLDIPIVYITAHQDEDTIEKTKDTNPYGYITKPLDDRDLNTAINSAMYRFDVESRLKAAEEKYFRLTENAKDMIFTQFIGSSAYNYVNRSAQEITGYSPDEFYSKATLIEDIVHPDWRKSYISNKKKVISGTLKEPFEYKILDKNGNEKWLNQRSVLVNDDDGKPVIIEAIVTDVTERKHYEEKLEESTNNLRALSNYLQKVREEERLYISREIHDQLGQDLTVLKMDLAMLGKSASKASSLSKDKNIDTFVSELKVINSSIDLIINKVRKIATDLRPDILDKLGLVEAIEWHAGEFEKRSSIKCITKLSEREPEISNDKAITIFRIFQETLTNAARHSGASEIEINLKINDGMLALTVSDNGRGITDEEIGKGSSLGILGMKERISILGGKWDIKGVPGKGTKIKMKVPIN
jgi:two-component system, NarL family, sensor histidine kinase UhpB